MKPVIGITAGFNHRRKKHLLSDYYVQAVENSGGIPVILPSVDIEVVDRLYEMVDGLIFSGGCDVDPHLFGETPQKGIGEITPKRDQFELCLAQKALKGTKPVLGICRGIQVLNIAAGGSLYQDISGVTVQEHDQKAPEWFPFHEVEILENSLLFKIIGRKKIKVNSFHHQAVKNLGQGLKKVGWTNDGIIEAVESISEGKTILGVQWHPECNWDRAKDSKALFEFLVNSAREKKGVVL